MYVGNKVRGMKKIQNFRAALVPWRSPLNLPAVPESSAESLAPNAASHC